MVFLDKFAIRLKLRTIFALMVIRLYHALTFAFIYRRRQARPEVGARHERTLEAVACMPLLGRGYAPTSRCSLATAELHMTRRLTCTRQHACLCAVRWSPCLLCRATGNWFPMML